MYGALEMKLGTKKLHGTSLDLHNHLSGTVISQRVAIQEVVDGFQKYFAGIRVKDKPLGIYLLVGPTGVGKTKFVEEIARFFSLEDHFIKIDCAEFQHSHETAKLIGSPPGYLGHRETPARFNKHLEKKSPNFILFDEIEKANDSLWNILLGVLDKATLTNGSNETVNFANSFIFMTSNIGMDELKYQPKSNIGFQKVEIENNREKVISQAIKDLFRPEFINRLDKIIHFESLTEEDISKIFELEIANIQSDLLKNDKASFLFTIEASAKAQIIQEGFSKEYGARLLKRTIDRYVTRPIANLICSQQIGPGDLLLIKKVSDELEYHRVEKKNKAPRAAAVDMIGVL